MVSRRGHGGQGRGGTPWASVSRDNSAMSILEFLYREPEVLLPPGVQRVLRAIQLVCLPSFLCVLEATGLSQAWGHSLYVWLQRLWSSLGHAFQSQHEWSLVLGWTLDHPEERPDTSLSLEWEFMV